VIGDPVLVRSDGVPAYNFAVVIDDALMAITHVIRGEDHISNTPRQILLYEAFGWTPPSFAHVSLVMGPDHAPLSKRHGATSVAEFRARGYLPEALTNYLALLGWSPGEGDELLPMDELAKRFSLDDVGKSAGVFDIEKLSWVNRHYLKAASPVRLAALSVAHLKAAGWLLDPTPQDMAFLAQVVPPIASSVDRLDQVPSRLRFLFDYSAERALGSPALLEEAMQAREVVAALAHELAAAPPMLDRESFRATAARVKDRTGQKGKALFHPLRIVLTGEPDGLELDIAVPAIEHGAQLEAAGSGFVEILSARERAEQFAAALDL
jgi:glutamyl-tRNA synthetase